MKAISPTLCKSAALRFTGAGRARPENTNTRPWHSLGRLLAGLGVSGRRERREPAQFVGREGLRLAAIGDTARHLAGSSALRALVHESNRADDVWFVPGFDALDARLHFAA